MKPLAERYTNEILPALTEEFGIKNVYQVPKIEKVTVNIGAGYLAQNEKQLEPLMVELASITGQKPKINRAKKSIASFKIREKDPVGLSVTLRGKRMYLFLDKLINVVLPRIRDFRGVKGDSFDGRGNYNLGIREHIVFPEIDYNKIDRVKPLQITIKTTAGDNEKGRKLLELVGVPFTKEA